MNSLNNKVMYVFNHIHTHSTHIYAVTETWLNSTIPDSFLLPTNTHRLYRCDDPSGHRKRGVAAYISTKLNAVQLDNQIENVLTLSLPSLDIYIAIVYRPPNDLHSRDKRLIEFIDNFAYGRNVILLGDFNLPTLDWSSYTDLVDLTASVKDRNLYDCFLRNGLTQLVSDPTHCAGHTLDLVLLSQPDRLISSSISCPYPACDHFPFNFSLSYPVTAPTASQPQTVKLDWPRGDYGSIINSLYRIDWQHELVYLGSGMCTNHLVSELDTLSSLFIPVKKSSQSAPLWAVPKSLTIERNKSWISYKRTRKLHGRNSPFALKAYANISKANRNIKQHLISKREEHEERLASNIKRNPKGFHRYISRMKNSPSSVGPLTVRGLTSSDPRIMALTFDDAFSSVYVTNSIPNNYIDHHPATNSTLSYVFTTPEAVYNVIMSLKTDSSMGPDNIHPLLLKKCAVPLSQILCYIFNLSMLTGEVPEQWKFSYVTPIYKKGSRSEALNHRPICLSCAPCKIHERLIADDLADFCSDNNIISECQFGFVKGRSVEDSLLLTYDFIARKVDEGNQCDVILFDFTKAFDKVSHPLLLRKLQNIGITGLLHNWIANFLTGRFTTTRICGVSGDPREVLSGVPQGSVLGPLLFIIFINFITEGCESQFSLFADDLKLYATASTPQECSSLQRDIDRLHLNASNLLVQFNASKCLSVHFPANKSPLQAYQLNGTPIAAVNSARDLGVIIDRDLKFHQHVNSTYGKAHGLASNLLSHTSNRSLFFMKELYVSHVRPILTFASPVWNTGYIGDSRKLESVQRRWTREVRGFGELPYSDRLQKLNLSSIKGRLQRTDLIYCWKIFHGKCYIKPEQLFILSTNPTRGHCYKIFKPRIRTEIRRRSFSYRVISTWNSLPSDVVTSPTLTTFKTRLHRAIGQRFLEFD